MQPYYEENGIQIYHGDCRDVIASFPPCFSVDAVLTDPPYGVELTGKRTKRDASRVNGGYSEVFLDTPEYVANVVVPVVAGLVARVGRAVVTPGTRNMFMYPTPADVGCVFNPAGAGLGRWGFTCFHPILYYGKCPYLAAGMGHRPNGFFDLAAGELSGHPCAKPLRWMKWLVGKCSLEGDSILDPFMGSGTTLRAAKDLGRKAIGIEIEERYCEIAANRLRQEVLDFDTQSRNELSLETENEESQDALAHVT